MSVWDNFYNNPILSEIIEEAETKLKSVESDDDPTPEESSNPNLEQIAQGVQNGDIGEEELTKMYQNGSLSKEEIQQVLEFASGGGQSPEEQISPEEMFAQQVDQVNDSFIRFSIYDKVNDLESKLDDFLENFSEVNSELYAEVQRIREFLKILSSLTFSLDVSVLYQMYGSLEMRLIEIFDGYSKEQNKEAVQDKAEELTKDAEDHYNNMVNSEDNEEIKTQE